VAVPAATRQPAPHSALRRLVAGPPVAAFLAMVYVVSSAVALAPALAQRLDHTLFHFVQVPLLLILAFFGYQAYRKKWREHDHGVSHPDERKEITDDRSKMAPSS
jgi:hypothetical protein